MPWWVYNCAWSCTMLSIKKNFTRDANCYCGLLWFNYWKKKFTNYSQFGFGNLMNESLNYQQMFHCDITNACLPDCVCIYYDILPNSLLLRIYTFVDISFQNFVHALLTCVIPTVNNYTRINRIKDGKWNENSCVNKNPSKFLLTPINCYWK